MILLVFFAVVSGLLILRLAPGALLKLFLLMPRQKCAGVVRWLRKSVSQSWDASDLRTRRVLVRASSLLAIAGLVTTALLTWHAAELLLVMN